MICLLYERPRLGKRGWKLCLCDMKPSMSISSLLPELSAEASYDNRRRRERVRVSSRFRKKITWCLRSEVSENLRMAGPQLQ